MSQMENGPNLTMSWAILDFIKYKWIPKYPLLSQVVLNGILQSQRENGRNLAFYWPFLDVLSTN